MARARVKSYGSLLRMAYNMGVPNNNVRLKYAHLHDYMGHRQFAPKGGCITFPSHMHFAPLMLPYGTDFMMVTLVDDGRVPAPENGATQDRISSCPGQTPSFHAYYSNRISKIRYFVCFMNCP